MSYRIPCSLCKCRECSTCRLCIERRICKECPRCNLCIAHQCTCPPKSPPLFPMHQRAISARETHRCTQTSGACLAVPSMTCLSAPSTPCTMAPPPVCCSPSSCGCETDCCPSPAGGCGNPEGCCSKVTLPCVACSSPCCTITCKCRDKTNLYCTEPNKCVCLTQTRVCEDTVELIRSRLGQSHEAVDGAICVMEKSPGCYIPVQCATLKMPTRADQEERLGHLSPSASFIRQRSAEAKSPTPELQSRKDLPPICADKPQVPRYEDTRLPTNVTPAQPKQARNTTFSPAMVASREDLPPRSPKTTFRDDTKEKPSRSKSEKRKERKEKRRKG